MRGRDVDGERSMGAHLRRLKGLQTEGFSRRDSLSLRSDCRYALRNLQKHWLLSVGIVGILAVGLGIPAVVFSIWNAIAFRSPSGTDPEKYFRVVRADLRAAGVATLAEYHALEGRLESVRELGAWSSARLVERLGDGDSSPTTMLLVSCNLLKVFGVDAPLAGRLLRPEDCQSRDPVAVMSAGLWRAQFGADIAVVGRSLRYGGVSVTIVGVAELPAIQVRGHSPEADTAADFWVPYTVQGSFKESNAIFRGRDLLNDKDSTPWLELAGLLNDGVARSKAEVEVQTVASSHVSETPWPPSRLRLTDGSRWGAMPLRMVQLSTTVMFLPLAIMVTACINVAALLLTRATSRTKEMAVRTALGAKTTDLFRMLMVESTVISVLATVTSLSMVFYLPTFVISAFGAERWVGGATVTPDWRVFIWLACCSVATAVLTGLAPAHHSMGSQIAASLGTRGSGAQGGIGRVTKVFIGVQVAMGVLLLVAAGAFVRAGLLTSEPGFKVDGILIAELSGNGENDESAVTLDQARAGLVEALGGAAALSASIPLVSETSERVRVSEAGTWLTVPLQAVSPEFFAVFEIPMIAGRGFQASDSQESAANPVVISKQFAEKAFGGSAALGQTLITSSEADVRRTIVGIVENRTTGRGMSDAASDMSAIYQPINSFVKVGFVLLKPERMTDETSSVAGNRLKDLGAVDVRISLLASLVDAQTASLRRLEAMLLISSLVASVLALLGLFATISTDASRRTKEFAIRIALGAAPQTFVRDVLYSGLRLIALGLVLGVAGSWGVLRVIDAQRLLPIGGVGQSVSPYLAAVAAFIFATTVSLATIGLRASRLRPIDELNRPE